VGGNGAGPAFSVETATDAMLQASTPTTNFGSADYVQVKGGGNKRHGLLRWDLSSLPSGTVVRTACVRINIEDPSNVPYPGVEVFRDWSEAAVTWEQNGLGQAWQVAGAYGPLDAGDQAVITLPQNERGAQTRELSTQLVQRWLSTPSQNHGILFGNDGSADGVTFSSSNTTNQGGRPKLLIYTN
jgi:hypothetical protein